MTKECADLVVVGAGPAGLRGAIEAARAGLTVVVVDENASPGGQIFRQLPEPFSVLEAGLLGRDFASGQSLLHELRALSIRFLLNATLWGSFEDRVLEIVQGERGLRVQAEAILLATGAYDRPVPLPGWTLPGVLTAGGAQTLLKSQRLLPGRRILMAGAGPLQLVVASQLVKAGADVVAVAEAVPTRSVLSHLGSLLRAWRITRDGVEYRWSLFKRRVPWIAPAVLVRVEGQHEVERATIASVDAEWRPLAGTERTFEVDTVCVGYGLVPSVELARLLGCTLRFDGMGDVWVPDRDDEFETSMHGIYAVGDGAGIGGALVAEEEGRIAGLAIARALGRLSTAEATELMKPARRRLRYLGAFRGAMADLYRIRPGLHELATPETIVCRCEERTRREIEAAIDEGARQMDHLKAWARAGMGSCSGRMCGLPTLHLLARRVGHDLSELGWYRARPPVKPVAVGALVAQAGEIGGYRADGEMAPLPSAWLDDGVQEEYRSKTRHQ